MRFYKCPAKKIFLDFFICQKLSSSFDQSEIQKSKIRVNKRRRKSSCTWVLYFKNIFQSRFIYLAAACLQTPLYIAFYELNQCCRLLKKIHFRKQILNMKYELSNSCSISNISCPNIKPTIRSINKYLVSNIVTTFFDTGLLP